MTGVPETPVVQAQTTDAVAPRAASQPPVGAEAPALAAPESPAAPAPTGAEVPAAAADTPTAPAEAPAASAEVPSVPGGEAASVPAPDAAAAPGGGAAPSADGMGDAGSGLFGGALDPALRMLHDGGPAVWAIAALSVVTVALILWKTWTLIRLGAWSRARSERAMAAYMAGGPEAGLAALRRRPGLRGRMLRAGFAAVASLPPEAAREETARVAKRELADARTGLRALELIATAAPLLGLLGTVLGMIAAFRTLQEAGGRADPAMLAGGIWEALLTTAAGMAVAIPASAALTWFESVADRARQDMEDLGARLFLAPAVARAASVPGLPPERSEPRADAA